MSLVLAKAEQQITVNHLRFTVARAPSSTVGRGNVISTNPPNGNSVPENSVVTLNVSTGAAKIQVPDVTNQSQTQAESRGAGQHRIGPEGGDGEPRCEGRDRCQSL